MIRGKLAKEGCKKQGKIRKGSHGAREALQEYEDPEKEKYR